MHTTRTQTDPQNGVEMKKTAAFVGAALVIGLLAWWTMPGAQEVETTTVPRNAELFPNFKSALDATSLSIEEFDEPTATIRPFKVAKVNGNWVIPSHQNYPTDAKDQLAAAAANLVGLRILGQESDSPGDHAKFGVIAPIESEIRDHGTKGVGTRVTLGNANDAVLFDAIVGNEVKDAPGQRYVRLGTATQLGKEPRYSDAVYVVPMKTDKITSKFENWIERDLLKMNAFDLKQVELKDYSVDTVLAPTGKMFAQLHNRSDITVDHDDQKAAWTLVSLKEFDDKQQPVDVPLEANEELNLANLHKLKTALSDLKIVDVERKPEGVGADLESLVRDREGYASLISNGFTPRKGDDGKVDILSNEGDIRLRMKDGVDYVLRFGAVAALDSGAVTKDEKKETGQEGEAAKNQGRNRYVMVMAEFKPERIAKPEIQPLPEDNSADAKDAAAKAKDKGADAAQGDAAKAEGDKPMSEKEAIEKAMREAQHDAIVKKNQRAQDSYDAAIKAGEEHAKTLNERFGNWYYIVSDDVYHKLHLGRDEVVKKKQDPAKDPNAALQQLQEGLPLAPEGEPQQP